METIVDLYKDKLEKESSLYANDMQLPTVAPTAEPPPKRTLTLIRKLAIALSKIILFDSLFTVVTFAVIQGSVPIPIMTGVFLVMLWEAFVQRSLEAFPTFTALLTIYWSFLGTTVIGCLIVSVGAGVTVGTGCALYLLYTKGIHAEKADRVKPVDASTHVKNRPSVVLVCLFLGILSTAAMPTGIFAIRWSFGRSLHAATESYLRPTVIMFVGTATNTSYTLYKEYKKANKTGVRLTGEDEVPPGQAEGAQGANQDGEAKV